MKKVDSAIANDTAAGDGWFKIWDESYDETAGKWATEKMIANDGHLSVSIPEDIEGGSYLLRSELLALHNAEHIPADPQFFVGCAQIFLSSAGTKIPSNTVSIPGYIDMTKNNAALTFNIYAQPMALPYPMIGPTAYTSSSKRDLEVRSAAVQTEGLIPANTVLQSVNWFGSEVASYSDMAGCWNVRLHDASMLS